MSGSPFSLQVRFTTVQGSATHGLNLKHILLFIKWNQCRSHQKEKIGVGVE
jgi:hypothetical protein